MQIQWRPQIDKCTDFRNEVSCIGVCVFNVHSFEFIIKPQWIDSKIDIQAKYKLCEVEKGLYNENW